MGAGTANCEEAREGELVWEQGIDNSSGLGR